MSLVLSGTLRFPEADLAAADAALADMMQGCRAQPGCLACVYSRELAQPGLYRVFQHWQDEALFMAGHEAPHFARWRLAREALGMYDRRYVLHEVSATRDA